MTVGMWTVVTHEPNRAVAALAAAARYYTSEGRIRVLAVQRLEHCRSVRVFN